MPLETAAAITWALTQLDADGHPITNRNHHWLVHKVREYFNSHNIAYVLFGFPDLIPYSVSRKGD